MAADDDTGFLSRWSRRKAEVRQGGVSAEPAAHKVAPQVDRPMAPPVAVPATPTLRSAEPDAAGAGTAAHSPNDPMQATASDAHQLAAQPGGCPESHPATPTPTGPTSPPPTLAEAAALTPASDFRRFVAPGVDAGVKNAALKQLFTDPHFNVMDRLDTYIDDYGLPDPLPPGMLRQMAQSKMLGLFDDEDENAAAVALGAPAADSAAADTAAEAPAADADATQAADATVASTPADPAPPHLSNSPHEDADLRLQPHHDAGCQSAEPGAGQDPGRLL